MKAVCLLLFLSCAVVAVLASSDSCTVPNDCANNGDTLHCVPVDANVPTPTLRCRECQTTCDCNPGQFCITDHTSGFWNSDEVGTCRGYDYRGIIGRPCIALGMADVQRGNNDQLYCGLVTSWNSFTLKAAYVEWEGVCQYGVCQMCEDGPSSSCGYNPRVCINSEFVPYAFSDGTIRTLINNATGAAATAITILFVLIATAWSCAWGVGFCMRRHGGLEKVPLLGSIVGGGAASSHSAASEPIVVATETSSSSYGTA